MPLMIHLMSHDLFQAESNEVSMATVTFDVLEGALSALRLSPTEFVKEMRSPRLCFGTGRARSRNQKALR